MAEQARMYLLDFGRGVVEQIDPATPPKSGTQCIHKTRYRTRADAIEALAYLIGCGHGEQRVYHCQLCAHWHLTSRPAHRLRDHQSGLIALLTLPGHE